MEYNIKSGSPAKQRVACIVVGVFEYRRLAGPAAELDQVSGGYVSGITRRGDMDGKLEQTLLLHNVPNTLCDRVLLVGCGKEREFDDKRFRKAVRAATRALDACGARDVVSYLPELHVRSRDTPWKVREYITVTEHTLYRFDQLKSKKSDKQRQLLRMTLGVPSRRDLDNAETAMAQGLAIAEGVKLARDVSNLPGNICTPSYLGDQALQLGKQHDNLKVTVLQQKDMEALKMGALLAVAKGSREPAKLIVMEYQGAKPSQAPYVLVGKGLTFDAGGISIKPAANMDEMKYDMCGGASVLGTLAAVAAMKLPINVVGIIPSTENMPDGSAIKPGDVVTSMSGQTIEILNTDAEGRLILCDALTYARRYNPATIIDIATLTGACIIALGNHASGLFSHDEELADDLLKAGQDSGDRAWQLPLWEEYQKALDSNFADMANVGGREGGSITAACFLSRYTQDLRWAHLDIAGVAWLSGKNKGATGRPVPLLVSYLLAQCGGAQA